MASKSSGRGVASQSAAASGKQRDADFGINPARACASNAVKVFFGCQTVCHMTKSQTNHLGRLK
jgi:hypothetical protein